MYWYEFNVVCVITGILITVYFGKRMTRQIKMRVVHIFIDRHSKMVKKPLLQHSRFVIYMFTNRSVKNIIYKNIEDKKFVLWVNFSILLVWHSWCYYCYIIYKIYVKIVVLVYQITQLFNFIEKLYKCVFYSKSRKTCCL